jgi:hypothetical protein
MTKDKLKTALAEVAVERARSKDRLGAIAETKSNYRKKAAEMASRVKSRAERGEPGAEIAYMNLKRAEKLCED